MYISDPEAYFGECHLLESRVIELAVNQEDAQVRLVIDYAAEVVSTWFEARLAGTELSDHEAPPSDFRRFTFCDVSSIQLDPQLPLVDGPMATGWREIVERVGSATPIVAGFQLGRGATGFRVTLVIQSMRDIQYRFPFGGVTVERKLGRKLVDERGNWTWRDAESKLPFDPRHPFGGKIGGGNR